MTATVMLMSELKNIHNDGSIFIGTWQNLVILDVGAEVGVAHAKLLHSAYPTLLAEFPGGIAILAMIRQGTPIASAPARAQSARSARELGARLLHVAIVLEERGVVAQLIRTVMRAMNMPLRQTPIVLFDTVESAIAATLPAIEPATMGANLSAELQAVVDVVRRNYKPRL